MKPYRSIQPLAMVVCLVTLADLAMQVLAVGGPLQKVGGWIDYGLLGVFAYFAACNLGALGAEQPRFTPGDACAWVLVPIVNFYMMHQVMTALWRESQPRPGEPRRARADFSVLAVNVWWGLWIAFFVFFIVKVRLVHAGGALAPFLASAGPTITQGFIIAGRVAFIVVVLGISARQREQWLDLERRRKVPQPTAEALR